MDSDSMFMEISQHIFRQYNIRGLCEEITPDVARMTARALVYITTPRKVVVGRDMRVTSPDLARAAIETLCAAGIDVVDIGMCTSSMYNFAVTSRDDIDAGIMITASHNPAEYNGIKLARKNGMPIAGTEIFSLRDCGPVRADKLGICVQENVLYAYLQKCMKRADIEDGAARGVKIVIDYGNGMGSVSLAPLCARLGLEVIPLYETPDAHFPNHEANPAKKETLSDLLKKVREVGADFGVATDGDADRIAFVDNEGEIISGDITLALLAQDALRKHLGATVHYSFNCGWIVDEVVAQAGGIPRPCPVGNTNIIRIMHEEGSCFGGELSSHFFFPEFAHLETIDYAFLRMLKLWRAAHGSFADLVRPLRRYVNSGEINEEIEKKDAVMTELARVYGPQATKTLALDGVRYEFGRDWWFLVRKSNTEPLLRLIIEARSSELLEEKKAEVLGVVHACIDHAS